MDSSKYPLVNTFVVGAQKSGTRALAFYLSTHPQIMLSKETEPHFFDQQDCLFDEQNVNWYHELFRKEEGMERYVDVTPSYMFWPDSIERISTYNPDSKIICVLRNPVSRCYSQWNMDFRRGRCKDQFMIAVLKEIFLYRKKHRVYSFLKRGFYTSQITEILKCFNEDQCFFLKQEDLFMHPSAALEKIFRFLGVSAFPIESNEIIHGSSYVSSMNLITKALLKLFYFFEIRKLEKLLKWDCSMWKSL